MTEIWQTLKVGDYVRLVEVPQEFFKEGCYIHKDTMRVYKKLLTRKRRMRICEIDEWGSPWIHCRFKLKKGWEYHFLSLNHSGIVKVKTKVKL